MLNLDTHVLLHALTSTLTRREEEILANDRWSISAIVLWEIAKLAQLGRIEIDPSDADVTRVFSKIHLWPIELDIALESTKLDFQGDPADELIAATSVVHNLPLVTRDKRLRKSRKI